MKINTKIPGSGPYINTYGSRGCLQCSVDEISFLCRIPVPYLSLYFVDLKRCIWKFYQIFSPSLLETFQANVKISFFFLASDFFQTDLVPHRVLYTAECQAFLPVVRIGSPHPLTRKGMLPLPPLGPGGGRYAFACGRGSGRIQFRRRDRHSGILCSTPFV